MFEISKDLNIKREWMINDIFDFKRIGFFEMFKLNCEGSMIYYNFNILNKRFVVIKLCNRCIFSMYVIFYIENCDVVF